MCRHTQAVCVKFSHLLHKPIADVWLISKYIDAVKDFEVVTPSETESSNVSGAMSPGPINICKLLGLKYIIIGNNGNNR